MEQKWNRKGVSLTRPSNGFHRFRSEMQLQLLTIRRLVDKSGAMIHREKTNTSSQRQIVGFSISPELASKVKAEAGRRNLSLKKLFEELWALYERHSDKNKAVR